jgi:hypothetical protein
MKEKLEFKKPSKIQVKEIEHLTLSLLAYSHKVSTLYTGLHFSNYPLTLLFSLFINNNRTVGPLLNFFIKFMILTDKQMPCFSCLFIDIIRHEGCMK